MSISIDRFFRVFQFLKDNPQVSLDEAFKGKKDLELDEFKLISESLKFDPIYSLSFPKDLLIAQTALHARDATRKYWRNVVFPGSFAYNTNDMALYRKMIIDWAATNKTFSDMMRRASDVFTLDDDDVDKAILGFGVDFFNKKTVNNITQRQLFLLALAELYKIKGTPQSVLSSLGFVTNQNLIMREYWIELDPDDSTKLRIRGTSTNKNGQEFSPSENRYINNSDSGHHEDIFLSWEEFQQKLFDIGEPHWWYKSEEILAIEHDPSTHIGLPSITPYFGIDYYPNIQKYNILLAVIEKIISDQLNSIISGNIDLIPREIGVSGFNEDLTEKDLWIEGYDQPLSMLEVFLGFTYSQVRADEYDQWKHFSDFLKERQVDLTGEEYGVDGHEYTYPWAYFELVYWTYINKDVLIDGVLPLSAIVQMYEPFKSNYYLSETELFNWWTNKDGVSGDVPEIFYQAPFNYNLVKTDTTLDRILFYNGTRNTDYKSVDFEYNEIIEDYNRFRNLTVERKDFESDYNLYNSSNRTNNKNPQIDDVEYDYNTTYFNYVSNPSSTYYDTFTHDGVDITPLYAGKYPVPRRWNWGITSDYLFFNPTPKEWVRFEIENLWASGAYLADSEPPSNVDQSDLIGLERVDSAENYIYKYVSRSKWVRAEVETDWEYCESPVTSSGVLRLSSELADEKLLGKIDSSIAELYIISPDSVGETLIETQLYIENKTVNLTLAQFKEYLVTNKAIIDSRGNIIKDFSSFVHNDKLYRRSIDVDSNSYKWWRIDVETDWDVSTNGTSVFEGFYKFPNLDLRNRYDAERILRGAYSLNVTELPTTASENDEILVCEGVSGHPETWIYSGGAWTKNSTNRINSINLGINNNLVNWIDGNVDAESGYRDTANRFLESLSSYVRLRFGEDELDIAAIYKNVGNTGVHKDLIDFFKPKRARLLSFAIVLDIDDRLNNSIVMEDAVDSDRVTQVVNDYIPRNDSRLISNNDGIYKNAYLESELTKSVSIPDGAEFYLSGFSDERINGYYFRRTDLDTDILQNVYINYHNMMIAYAINDVEVNGYREQWIIGERNPYLDICEALYVNYSDNITDSWYVAGTLPNDNIRFGFLADHGNDGSIQTTIASNLQNKNCDLYIFGGDNNYPSGAESTLEDNWLVWQDQINAGIVYPVLGNHDLDTDDGQPQIDYFTGKTPGFGIDNNGRYYDFVSGNVHFFILNSGWKTGSYPLDGSLMVEPDGNTIGSVQYNWFVDKINNSTARWKVVVFHHPIISEQNERREHSDMDWGFDRFGVDVVLNGHVHQFTHHVRGGLNQFIVGATSNASKTDIDEDHREWPDYLQFGFDDTRVSLHVDSTEDSLTFHAHKYNDDEIYTYELAKPMTAISVDDISDITDIQPEHSSHTVDLSAYTEDIENHWNEVHERSEPIKSTKENHTSMNVWGIAYCSDPINLRNIFPSGILGYSPNVEGGRVSPYDLDDRNENSNEFHQSLWRSPYPYLDTEQTNIKGGAEPVLFREIPAISSFIINSNYNDPLVSTPPLWWTEAGWETDRYYSGPTHKPVYIGVKLAIQDCYPCNPECCDYFDIGCEFDGSSTQNLHNMIWNPNTSEWNEGLYAEANNKEVYYDVLTKHYGGEKTVGNGNGGFIDGPTFVNDNSVQTYLETYEELYARDLGDGDTYCNACDEPLYSPDLAIYTIPQVMKDSGVFHESIIAYNMPTASLNGTWNAFDTGTGNPIDLSSYNLHGESDMPYGYKHENNSFELVRVYDQNSGYSYWEIRDSNVFWQPIYMTKPKKKNHSLQDMFDSFSNNWRNDSTGFEGNPHVKQGEFLNGHDIDVCGDSFIEITVDMDSGTEDVVDVLYGMYYDHNTSEFKTSSNEVIEFTDLTGRLTSSQLIAMYMEDIPNSVDDTVTEIISSGKPGDLDYYDGYMYLCTDKNVHAGERTWKRIPADTDWLECTEDYTNMLQNWRFNDSTWATIGQNFGTTTSGGDGVNVNMDDSNLTGTSIIFNGVDEYVTGPSFDPGTYEFAFMAWIKYSSNGEHDFMPILSSGAYHNEGFWWGTVQGWQMGLRGNKLRVYLADADNYSRISLTSDNSVPTDTWVHVAFATFNRNIGEGAKLYINGVPDPNTTWERPGGTFGLLSTKPIYSSINADVGKGYDSTSGLASGENPPPFTALYFEGEISDFRYYRNRIISDEEVECIYRNGRNLINPDLSIDVDTEPNYFRYYLRENLYFNYIKTQNYVGWVRTNVILKETPIVTNEEVYSSSSGGVEEINEPPLIHDYVFDNIRDVVYRSVMDSTNYPTEDELDEQLTICGDIVPYNETFFGIREFDKIFGENIRCGCHINDDVDIKVYEYIIVSDGSSSSSSSSNDETYYIKVEWDAGADDGNGSFVEGTEVPPDATRADSNLYIRMELPDDYDYFS